MTVTFIAERVARQIIDDLDCKQIHDAAAGNGPAFWACTTSDDESALFDLRFISTLPEGNIDRGLLACAATGIVHGFGWLNAGPRAVVIITVLTSWGTVESVTVQGPKWWRVRQPLALTLTEVLASAIPDQHKAWLLDLTAVLRAGISHARDCPYDHLIKELPS